MTESRRLSCFDDVDETNVQTELVLKPPDMDLIQDHIQYESDVDQIWTNPICHIQTHLKICYRQKQNIRFGPFLVWMRLNSLWTL